MHQNLEKMHNTLTLLSWNNEIACFTSPLNCLLSLYQLAAKKFLQCISETSLGRSTKANARVCDGLLDDRV